MVALSREEAEDFALWILAAVSERQDHLGRKPARGQRRTHIVNGEKQPVLMYSRGVSNEEARSGTWGLCWQPGNERGRGNDFSWRLTLAVKALEAAGCSNWDACTYVVGLPVVLARVKGKETVNRIEGVRSTVNNYVKAWRQRIDIDIDLEIWIARHRGMRGGQQFLDYTGRRRLMRILRLGY